MRQQHRLKVAIVGESESGRTTLCKSLEDAAEHKTTHPLVASGQPAALKMDAAVLSVQTYDVACGDDADALGGESSINASVRGEKQCLLEVTVVDSGPAPLSDGAGTMAMMEADVVLVCFPLCRLKQVVPLQSNGKFGLSLRPAQPTEAFIHTRDYRLLTTLLMLLSTRCGGGAGDVPSSNFPSIVLVGTFQDVLTDASVAATHTILRALQRLCDGVRQCSSSIPPVTDVSAVSATQATAVLLTSEKHVTLRDWWLLLLQRAATVHASRRPPASTASPSHPQPSREAFIALPALLHLLAHPNRLHALSAGVRQINSGNGSPRLLDVSVDNSFTPYAFQEIASAAMRAEDARVTSLVVDFITQLKARKRVWMLPLPKLWRVAYALGMQSREQLYLVLRQMEAAGEVLLLGRALSYAQEARLGGCGSTNETVCLCPALLRTSYSILYVYVDRVAHRQGRHVRKCLRNVELSECALGDPTSLAAKGIFPLPLLRRLAVALGLRNTSPSEAAELLIAALIGSDLAYLAYDPSSQAGNPARSLSRASLASHFSNPQDPLQPPLLSSSSAAPSPTRRRGGERLHRSSDSAPASPLHSRGLVLPPPSVETTASVTGDSSPSNSTPGEFPLLTPSAADLLLGVEDDSNYSPNITVAELTSLFLLGELTSSQATSESVQATAQRSERSSSPTRCMPPPEDDAVLIVPSLQQRTLCPDAVTHHILARASATESAASSGQSLRSSQVLLRVEPYPYDLVALLTCRFASLALRVERAYSNAALLSYNVTELLRPTTDRASRSQRKRDAASQLTTDGCCFLFCAPPSDETAAAVCCSTVLRLVCFADSHMRVARLALALCTEMHLFALQRLPGVTVAQAQDTDASADRDAATHGVSCANVAALLCSLNSLA
ncbi:hypothetical protein ABB37_03992 [Leptomonas pyrrhocoris]|uniref:Uncharacterized protein n=1 Tax=Leptomonas pyrrhocoris TaxID=157538 RepID=A0A0N0DWE1_LEPPY|nr:hypothetical protein ABB37_03992 [Leptomonas pyrrhocoris]KPA81684.1 hypothetical protein ABB37_03992 [Leptomonas pyrrhocoris]|eukprot:XP_015660123.1 hypothetical protein ABB37_03992 [Leptomonas pyrrhocoris]